MTARAWSLGLGASVLMHGAGLAAIGLVTTPEEPPDQPVPRAQFTVEAAEVPRSRAEPEAAAGEAAAQSTAEGPRAASAAIPTGRAQPAALPSTALDTSNLEAQTLAPSQGQASTLTDSSQSSARVAALAPEAARLAPASAPQAAQPALAPESARLAPEAAPETPQRVSARTPEGATVRAATTAGAPLPISSPQAQTRLQSAALGDPAQPAVIPEAARAAPAQPETQGLAPAALPATAGKATLAWAGGEEAAVSAASLAAITAFTQEGDLSAAAAEVRDGIEGILSAVPCARLQTTFLPDTGQLELRGHIPDDALRGPVLAALRAQVGDAIPLSDNLLILPRPQCGALAGIAALGLPQSNEQLDNPSVIGADGFARNTVYTEGDLFFLELTGADYDAYLYVDYFDKDGNVIHLQPNKFVPNELVAADRQVLVAKSENGKPALELRIAPPFGQEIAAAFAASVPLYEGSRPLVEPAGPYLDFLKERVAATRAAHPDFKGEWVYFFITTQPR
ncbi:MAG: DUF4384 domain-containing protein [Pseudomonadota bacterium]